MDNRKDSFYSTEWKLKINTYGKDEEEVENVITELFERLENEGKIVEIESEMADIQLLDDFKDN